MPTIGYTTDAFLKGYQAEDDRQQNVQKSRQRTALEELLARRREDEQSRLFAQQNQTAATGQGYAEKTAATLAGTQATAATTADQRKTEAGVRDFGYDLAKIGATAAQRPLAERDPYKSLENPNTGDVVRPAQGPTPIPPVAEGNRRVTNYDVHGRPTYQDQPPSNRTTMVERYATEHGIPVEQAEQIMADARARGAVGARPMDASDKQVINALQSTQGAIRQFQEFTPAEVQKYSGMAQSTAQSGLSAARGLPIVGGAFGASDPRFEEFRALMGRFQAAMFQEGGKQLTGIEKQVASMYTPTGNEPGGAPQIAAKMRNLQAFTNISLKTRAMLAKTGKGDIDPIELERVLTEELTKAGLIRPPGSPPRPLQNAPDPGRAAPQGDTGWKIEVVK